MTIGDFVEGMLGPDPPVRVQAYDGTDIGPPDAPARIRISSPDALMRIVTAPGELGLARAYVAGDLDIEGDIWALFELRHRVPRIRIAPAQVWELVQLLGGPRKLRRPPPPPEEARVRGRLHSRHRDAASVSHHYDVSNDFYRMVLGPSMTYSCAVFSGPDDTLDQAQANKYELICQKLGLSSDSRLLDIGCGWGGMVIHAAREHGARCVGVTVSAAQAELAEKRVAEAGLAGQVEIRLQDYRDVRDGPYDAISSIGMFEHVGLARLQEYFDGIRGLLRPGGRLLNHAISRPSPGQRPRIKRAGFIDRYVFPDGELHEVGSVVSAIQRAGLEARHMESLREHYARTLRSWVANLEANWDEAVAEAGEPRAKIWRLYMAGSAVMFEDGRINVNQVLATRAQDDGASGMPLRSDWAV